MQSVNFLYDYLRLLLCQSMKLSSIDWRGVLKTYYESQPPIHALINIFNSIYILNNVLSNQRKDQIIYIYIYVYIAIPFRAVGVINLCGVVIYNVFTIFVH